MTTPERRPPASAEPSTDLLRLLEVAMTARRMVEDGHPDSREWFRIMSERLSTVMDLTDAALMDGVEAVVEARATSPALDAIPTDDLIAELDRRNSIYEWTGIPHRARLSASGETPEQRRIRNEPNAEEGWSR